MPRISLTLLLFLGILAARGQGFDIAAHCEAKKELGDSLFLLEFPYGEYVAALGHPKVKEIERHRQTLNNHERDGTEIIKEALKRYFSKNVMHPADFQALCHQISLAEHLLNAGQYMDDPDYLYADSGDKFMSQLTKEVERQARADSLSGFERDYLAARLEENKYTPNMPISDWEKLSINLKQGNYGYIWKRIWGRYRYPFLALVGVGLLILGGIFWGLRKWWQGRKRRRRGM